jgi:hypothetical protein
MQPCVHHTAAAHAALVSNNMDPRGDDAVASLWASHGSALALAGVDFSTGFCPLCVIESRTPGAAATWIASACDGERASQLAQAAQALTLSAAASLSAVASASAAAASRANAAPEGEASP